MAPVWRSWTKQSWVPLVSPGTRLLARLLNTTKRPSAEMAGFDAAPVARPPGAVGGDPRDGPGLAVVDEAVPGAVGVARHQVAGGAREHDEAPVGGDGWARATNISLIPGGVGGDPRDGPGLAVFDEAVRGAIGIPRHQVAGVTQEHNEAPVGGDGWHVAASIALPPGGVGGDADDVVAHHGLIPPVAGRGAGPGVLSYLTLGGASTITPAPA